MADFYNLYGGAMLEQNVGGAKKNANNNANNNGNNGKNANQNGNNGKNEANNGDNDSNNGNNLNKEAIQRINSIKINTNTSVIGFWLIWFIAVFLLLSTYITTPIRYSEEFVFHTVTFNRFYYYLHIILLTLLCFILLVNTFSIL